MKKVKTKVIETNRLELEIKKGRSKTYTLNLKDEDGNAIDLTSKTVNFRLRKTFDDSAGLVIDKTMTIDSDPTTGIAEVSISSTETDSLTTGKYIGEIIVSGTSDSFAVKFDDFYDFDYCVLKSI